MADTLREIAQEAVAKTERSTFNYRTTHGEQVAQALKAEADKDVFTSLQIAAGEQISPAILRANLNVSVGILRANGNVDRPAGTDYLARHTRAEEAISRAESYFNDQQTFAEFKASTEGPLVIESTGRFLMSHPALSEYFANIPNAGQKLNAAKSLAEKYLQDPFAREKVRQALLDSAINKGEVADEFSEVERKIDAATAKVAALEAKIKRLEGDAAATPPTIGEIETNNRRRREFDRFATTTPPRAGTEFALSQTRTAEVAVLKSTIVGIDSTLQALRNDERALQAELKVAQRPSPPATSRATADILTDIAAKQGDIATQLTSRQTAESERATKEAEIKAIEDEKKQLDDRIREKQQELSTLKGELTSAKNEESEQRLKHAKMEAAKARSEEMAVSELENIFKKGVEQELMERLNKAKDATDTALEKAADQAKGVDEKKYLELRAKRHKTAEGKIDGKAINEDFTDMKRDSAEYRIERRPGNPNRVFISQRPRAGWGTTPPPANEIFYLTGPEFAIARMMSRTDEFGGDFIMSKLRDPEWMKTQSEDFAAQVLREKMYASRGWLRRVKTGVKRLTSTEIVKIKNSTWGSSILEQSLEASKAHAKEIDAALGGELLSGPGSWREKIGKMSNKKLALLIAVLATSGALLVPHITLAGLGTAASNISGHISAGAATGAAAGAATGLAIGHAGRSRDS